MFAYFLFFHHTNLSLHKDENQRMADLTLFHTKELMTFPQINSWAVSIEWGVTAWQRVMQMTDCDIESSASSLHDQ